MGDSCVSKTESSGRLLRGLVSVIGGAAIVAGLGIWLKSRDALSSPPGTSSAPPQVLGSSFDAPLPAAGDAARSSQPLSLDPSKTSPPAPRGGAPAAPENEKKEPTPSPDPAPPPAEVKDSAAKKPDPKAPVKDSAQVSAKGAKTPDAPSASPVPAPPETKAPSAPEKAVELTFAKLAAYRYVIPPRRPDNQKLAPGSDQIPANIRALNGKKVTIEGFMVPLDFDKGKIISVVLARNMFGCCFGDTPQINELICVVKADGSAIDYSQMARISGTLEVGEVFDQDGFLESLYRMKADGVARVEVK